MLDYALHDASLAGFARFVFVIRESMRAGFERHLAPAAAAGTEILLIPQRLTLPRVIEEAPPGRTKPWGTGFAVLAAASHLDSPFAVCNADDFYGRTAYADLVRELRRMSPAAPRTIEAAPSERLSAQAPAPAPRNPGNTRTRGATRLSASAPSVSPAPVPAATATYPLGATLSARGGVSRGICRVGPDGFLAGLEEGLDLERRGARVVGRTAAGRPTSVSAEAPACMSLWGFAPGIGPLLAERFEDFLVSEPSPAAEFYLTEAVADLVAAGRVRCRVLRATEQWLGVTFPGDRAEVAAALRAMVESGTYPRRLRPLPKGRSSCEARR